MKTEINLNYRSYYSESFSLKYSEKDVKEGEVSSSVVSFEGRSVSKDLISLGLYKETGRQEFSLNSPGDVEFVAAKKLSPDAAADNILGFVERRLQSEKEAGADTERLSGLLKDAKTGVQQGYDQARKDLEALGLLNEELEAEINESYGLVGTGLKELGAEYVGGQIPQVEPAPRDEIVEASAERAVVKEVELKQGREYTDSGLREVRGFDYASRSRSSADFRLTTQDGDIVSISFSNLEAFAFSARQQFSGLAIESSQSLAERFNLSVKGELDEDELEAINDLLAQLSEVSQSFFQGDIKAAFESALKVGFDGEEIAKFSLDLSQKNIEAVRAYGSPDNAISSQARSFAPLVSQANNLLDVSDLLSRFNADLEERRNFVAEMLDFDQAGFPGIEQDFLSNIQKFVDYVMA